jgi:hypothetical protein
MRGQTSGSTAGQLRLSRAADTHRTVFIAGRFPATQCYAMQREIRTGKETLLRRDTEENLGKTVSEADSWLRPEPGPPQMYLLDVSTYKFEVRREGRPRCQPLPVVAMRRKKKKNTLASEQCEMLGCHICCQSSGDSSTVTDGRKQRRRGTEEKCATRSATKRHYGV